MLSLSAAEVVALSAKTVMVKTMMAVLAVMAAVVAARWWRPW